LGVIRDGFPFWDFPAMNPFYGLSTVSLRPALFTMLCAWRYREDTAMEIVPIDRRREPRTELELSVVVWGIDTRGARFVEEARARDISLSGALLSGLTVELRSGDVVGLLYGTHKARYRVVWLRYDGGGGPTLVAVHRMEADVCPWLEVLAQEAFSAPATADTHQEKR
jgi:hypothetical protein